MKPLLALTFILAACFALSACGDSAPSVSAQAPPAPEKSKSEQAAKPDGKSEIEEERKKSKNPPKGAPWIREFSAAHAEAFASGKPIFIYSTKTY